MFIIHFFLKRQPELVDFILGRIFSEQFIYVLRCGSQLYRNSLLLWMILELSNLTYRRALLQLEH